MNAQHTQIRAQAESRQTTTKKRNKQTKPNKQTNKHTLDPSEEKRGQQLSSTHWLIEWLRFSSLGALNIAVHVWPHSDISRLMLTCLMSVRHDTTRPARKPKVYWSGKRGGWRGRRRRWRREWKWSDYHHFLTQRSETVFFSLLAVYIMANKSSL